MTKTRQDNNTIDRIDTIYIENKTELSKPIGSGATCDQNKTGQQRD